jgi:hypothetical protein
MKNTKSKILCVILLNMLDSELSKIIEEELSENNESHDMQAVYYMIDLLDDIEIVCEMFGKEVV